MKLIKKLMKDEEGQGLVEYALIIGLIAIVTIVTMQALGLHISTLWSRITTALSV